jgi:hypothetical protein
MSKIKLTNNQASLRLEIERRTYFNPEYPGRCEKTK